MDHALLTRRALYALVAPARTGWTMPIRRAGKKKDHRPIEWQMHRVQLPPSRKMQLARKSKAAKAVQWDKSKLAVALQAMKKSEF